MPASHIPESNADTGPTNNGPANTGLANTGPTDTGPANTGLADTGLTDFAFKDVCEDDWIAAAQRAPRAESLSSLSTSLPGGIEVAPLYSPHRHSTAHDPAGLPGTAPHTRGVGATSGWGDWQVRQIHDVTLEGTPDAIAVDTTSGVNAVTVARGWDPQHHSGALGASVGEAARAGVTIHLQAGASTAHVAALVGVLDDFGIDAGRVSSWLGLDPVAAAISGWRGHASSGQVSSGRVSSDRDELTNAGPTDTGLADTGPTDTGLADAGLTATMCSAALYAAEIVQRSPRAIPLEADGSVLADAGAEDATELAAMLATGVAWLRAICDESDGPRLNLDAAVRLLGFTLSAGPDAFLVTAKCRSLRWCWSRVLRTCGFDGDSLPMQLHAVTSTAMLSAADPWVNMLRATTATFGAANGGVDAITVRPFDYISAGPASSGLGWRVAANTQLILRHESRIGSVIDPAGGSWYLEDLTRQLARAAWALFQNIESSGGISAAVANGMLEDSIAAERAQRNERIAAGDQVLVGVTDFVDTEAALAPASSATVAEAGATDAADGADGQLSGSHTSRSQESSGKPASNQLADGRSGGLGLHRWAAPYEAHLEAHADGSASR